MVRFATVECYIDRGAMRGSSACLSPEDVRSIGPKGLGWAGMDSATPVPCSHGVFSDPDSRVLVCLDISEVFSSLV